jgi:hypothetical protein
MYGFSVSSSSLRLTECSAHLTQKPDPKPFLFYTCLHPRYSISLYSHTSVCLLSDLPASVVCSVFDCMSIPKCSSLAAYVFGCLDDWLTGWLTDGLRVWLDDWLTAWLLDDWLAGCVVDLMTDYVIGWMTDWVVSLMTDWLGGWLDDWPTNWLTDWMCGWLNDWTVGSLAAWLSVVYWLAD